MVEASQSAVFQTRTPDFRQAWQMVVGDLRAQISRADYDTWVLNLQPVSFRDSIFTVGSINRFARDWAEERLTAYAGKALTGYLHQPVEVRFTVTNLYYSEDAPAQTDNLFTPRPAGPQDEDPEPVEEPVEPKKTRKPRGAVMSSGEGEPPAKKTAGEDDSSIRRTMLARAYGSERAAIIQPERTLFLTMYFFNNWLPLLGHSAAMVVLAARSMCYWNPKTGVMRNQVETEMSELAKKAAVSVRTVKDVLANELVQKYFLRYLVRRTMTPNGVRTAGIWMTVRMDDPLTPEDQQRAGMEEDEHWLSPK